MADIRETGFTKTKNTKYCSELRNLPVVSIEEGQEIGMLNSFLIDPEKRRVAALVLSARAQRGTVRVVPFEAVVSFGSFALTISRASSVSDIAANPYFITLFEKDIMLLGAEVRGGGDNLLGFVKDFGIDFTDGTLLSLRLTSDSGFLSPYQANIPFTAVASIAPDKLTLTEDYGVEFKKDTPYSDGADISFVPLVTQDVQLKQIVGESLRNEIDRLRNEIRDRIFEQHDEYFVKRQKGIIERSLTESLSQLIETRVADAVQKSERDMSSHITAAIEAFFESEHLRRLYDYINKNKAEINESIETDAKKRSEILSQAVDLFNQKLSESEKRASDAASLAMKTFAGEVNASLAANKNSLDEKMTAAIETAARELKSEAAAWILEIEKKFSALENGAEKLSYEYNEALDTFRASTKSEWASFRKSLEEKSSAEWQRISRELDAVSERSASEKGAAEALYAELRAALNDLREGFKDELDSRLDELAQSQSASFKRELNNSLASAADRYNALLSERVAASSAELRKRFDAASDAASAESKRTAEKISSLSEDLNSAVASQNRSSDALSAQLRSALSAIESGAIDIAALSADIERHSESSAALKDEVLSLSANTAAALRALEEKIESAAASALDSAVDKSFKRADSHIANLLQGLPTREDFDSLRASIASEISSKQDRFDTGIIEQLEQRIATQDALISSLKEAIEKAHASKKSSKAAPAPDISEISSLVERIVAEKLASAPQQAASVTTDAFSAEIDKLRKEIAAAHAAGASTGDAPAQQHSADAADILQSINARLAPIEDNWTVADQSLSEIQRASEYHSDRLDTVEDNIASVQNSLDALNNLLRGTETRVGRLRDEVFSLGELIKSTAPQSGQTAATSSPADSTAFNALATKLTAIEEKLAKISNAPAAGSSDHAEQFEWLERNVTELAEKLHAVEKSLRDKPATPEAAAPDTGRMSALEQKVSSFEMILPAVTDFFKDSGIRESVNVIRAAQERADKMLPAFEKKLIALEETLAALRTSEAQTSHTAGTPQPPSVAPEQIDELKSLIGSSKKEFADVAAELKAAIESVERESRDHTSALVDTVQNQFDSALEDLSAKLETRLLQIQEETPKAQTPAPSVDVAELQKSIESLREQLAALTARPAETTVSDGHESPVQEAPALDEEKLQSLLDLVAKSKEFVTRNEALQMQDDVVQDAIIQIDARFAGVAMEADLDKIREAFRKQLKDKIDSMRDLVFDAFEGKIDEIKSFFDADRISRGHDGK